MSVAVVGAGPSGLGAAVELAATTSVTVVDRIPVAGGSAGWDDRAVRALADRARALAVDLRLGATALRWEPGRLLVAAPDGIAWRPATHLLMAGGRRPATAAELGLAGDRPAGVLPATVAKHVLEAGVPLWRRPLLLGDGPWAAEVAHLAGGLGADVLRLEPGWRASSVVGRDRVEGLVALRGAARRLIACDAVVLAADPRPIRNVEGAILADAAGVTYVEPHGVEGAEARAAAGAAIARAWLDAHARRSA